MQPCSYIACIMLPSIFPDLVSMKAYIHKFVQTSHESAFVRPRSSILLPESTVNLSSVHECGVVVCDFPYASLDSHRYNEYKFKAEIQVNNVAVFWNGKLFRNTTTNNHYVKQSSTLYQL